jgi:hypothetical protein
VSASAVEHTHAGALAVDEGERADEGELCKETAEVPRDWLHVLEGYVQVPGESLAVRAGGVQGVQQHSVQKRTPSRLHEEEAGALERREDARRGRAKQSHAQASEDDRAKEAHGPEQSVLDGEEGRCLDSGLDSGEHERRSGH